MRSSAENSDPECVTSAIGPGRSCGAARGSRARAAGVRVDEAHAATAAHARSPAAARTASAAAGHAAEDHRATGAHGRGRGELVGHEPVGHAHQHQVGGVVEGVQRGTVRRPATSRCSGCTRCTRATPGLRSASTASRSPKDPGRAAPTTATDRHQRGPRGRRTGYGDMHRRVEGHPVTGGSRSVPVWGEVPCRTAVQRAGVAASTTVGGDDGPIRDGARPRPRPAQDSRRAPDARPPPPSSSPSGAWPVPASPTSPSGSGTSPALVVYYFDTKENLLIAALRESETGFYAAAEGLLSSQASLRDRWRRWSG